MLTTYGEPDTPKGVSPVRREGAGNLLARAQAPDLLLYGQEMDKSPKRHLVRLNPDDKKIQGQGWVCRT